MSDKNKYVLCSDVNQLSISVFNYSLDISQMDKMLGLAPRGQTPMLRNQ